MAHTNDFKNIFGLNKLILIASLIALFSFSDAMAFNTASLDNKLDGYREKTKDYLVETKVILDRFNQPQAIEWLNSYRLLIAEKGGKVWLIDMGDKSKVSKVKIKGIPSVVTLGEGGILAIKRHPNYQINGWIYIAYAAANPVNKLQSATTLARFRLLGNKISNFEQLFQARPWSELNRNFGSRIAFDKELRVYVSIGDREERDNAQNLNNHLGKIIRLNSDGAVSQNNPFFQRIKATKNLKGGNFIYSYGHKNPQGLVFYNNKLYSDEHGPKGGDEFNLIEAGKNYGWPTISYGRDKLTHLPVGPSFKKGMKQPILYWNPSIGPSGLIAYEGKPFKKWKGNFFLGSLVFGQVIRIKLDSDDNVVEQEKIFDGRFGPIRDLAVGPNGLIYFITDKGLLVQINPVATSLVDKTKYTQ